MNFALVLLSFVLSFSKGWYLSNNACAFEEYSSHKYQLSRIILIEDLTGLPFTIVWVIVLSKSTRK